MRLADDAVIRRMDFGRECDEYMKKFTERRSGMTKLERELIVKRYMRYRGTTRLRCLQ